MDTMKNNGLLINAILLLATIGVTLIIHKVTLLLYFNNQALSIVEAFTIMVNHKSWFVKGMAVLNYLIKPVFFYIIIWMLKEAFIEVRNKDK